MAEFLTNLLMRRLFVDMEIEVVLELLRCEDPTERRLLEIELDVIRTFTHTGESHG